MKRSFFLVLLFVLPFAAYASTDGKPVSTEVKVARGGDTLAGTLLVPGKGSNWPVALIIAGSGPTDRNGNSPLLKGQNNSLKYLAEGLAKKGIATLRFDKRFLGGSHSARPVGELIFDDFVDDAALLIGWLHDQKQFRSVAVLGHSEGSLIGMRAIRQVEGRVPVAAYVSLSGAGQPIGHVLEWQLCKQLEALCPEIKRLMIAVKEGQPTGEINPMLQGIFNPAVLPFLKNWMQYDPAAEIAQLKCRVMIVNGTTDLQVQVSEAGLLHAARPEATYLIIEGMNHVFKEAPANALANQATYSDPELPVMKELIKGVSAFLLLSN